jgi:hypothetical protein
MLDIVALAALCELAIKGGNKALEEYKKRKLSNAEKELLIAAEEDGKFHIMRVGELPPWIRAGGEEFMDVDDPAIAAKYVDAFESLCKRGYIRRERGELFRLTHQGFEKARKLAY